MEVLLANPRGFCAGVDRAIDVVERALSLHGAPIYVRHEVVHNRFVVDDLRAKGAVFVEELDEVPSGGTVVFSAHGVSQSVRREAAERGLRVFDATCPLVTKVHAEVSRMRDQGREVVMIGHRGHPEVEGTMGQARDGIYLVETPEDAARLAPANPDSLAFVTQTTLSVDDAARIVAALKARFPGIVGPRKDDICYATQNRQDAVKLLAGHCDLVIVVGSPNSSNSNRLRELAERMGAEAPPVPAQTLSIERTAPLTISGGAAVVLTLPMVVARPKILLLMTGSGVADAGNWSVAEMTLLVDGVGVQTTTGSFYGPPPGIRGCWACHWVGPVLPGARVFALRAFLTLGGPINVNPATLAYTHLRLTAQEVD